MSDKLAKIEYNNKETVVQNNSFLEAHKGLSLQEYKFFMFLISKINPDNAEFRMFRVTALEFAKAIGVENSRYIYSDLQAVTKKLMERVVKIHKAESELLIQTHLLSSVYYWYGRGYVDIKISEDMAPYLLGLKRDFTQYKLSQITHLSSVYAMRIYELLKKQEIIGKRTFFIDVLREKLGISPDTLKAFKDFRLYVLEIAKREINEKTDIIVNYEFVKSGRKVAAIQFYIKPKNEHKKETRQLCAIRAEARNAKYMNEIVSFGFSQKAATALMYNMLDYEIEGAIAAVKDQIQKGNVKNSKAMLKTALKEKWSTNKNSFRLEEVVISSPKAAQNKANKNLSKSDAVTPKSQKIVKNRSTFMKVFDSLFKR